MDSSELRIITGSEPRKLNEVAEYNTPSAREKNNYWAKVTLHYMLWLYFWNSVIHYDCQCIYNNAFLADAFIQSDTAKYTSTFIVLYSAS